MSRASKLKLDWNFQFCQDQVECAMYGILSNVQWLGKREEGRNLHYLRWEKLSENLT